MAMASIWVSDVLRATGTDDGVVTCFFKNSWFEIINLLLFFGFVYLSLFSEFLIFEITRMSAPNSSFASSSHSSRSVAGPLGEQPWIRTEDRVVIAKDSALESKEVVVVIVEGIIRDQEHLEELFDDEAVALTLS